MEKVAFVKAIYLPYSETFIHNQINNLKNFTPVILTNFVRNIDIFPVKYLYKNSFYGILEYVMFKKIEYLNPWLHFSKYFINILKRENVSIIHAHFGPDGVYSTPLKKEIKIPLITSFYGYDASRLLKSKYWIERYKKLFNIGDLFLPNSNHIKNKLLSIGCPENKIIMHRLGMDVKKFKLKIRKYPENDKISLCFVGRLSEMKGLAYLLQAMPKVLEKYPNVSLKIIGDGEDKQDLINLSRQLSLEYYVRFLGLKSYEEYRKELYKSHIMVAPSITASNGDTEGQNLVIIEAQSSGMPIISTRHNGIPESVLDNKSGFLVKERDSNELAEKIIFLIENSKLWRKLGKAGRKHVEKEFNIEKQTKKLEKIYLSLL